MKKTGNAAPRAAVAIAQNAERPGWLKNHDHAGNCGHKSYVHGNHIDSVIV